MKHISPEDVVKAAELIRLELIKERNIKFVSVHCIGMFLNFYILRISF